MYLTGLWSPPISAAGGTLQLQFVPEEQRCLSVVDAATSHVSAPRSPGSRRADWETGAFSTCMTAGQGPWGSCAQAGKSFPLPSAPPPAGTRQVPFMPFDGLCGFRMESPPAVTL